MKQEGEKCGCCDQCLPTLTKGRCADGLICHKPGFLNICETYGRCRKAGGEYLHNHLLKKLTLMSHNNYQPWNSKMYWILIFKTTGCVDKLEFCPHIGIDCFSDYAKENCKKTCNWCDEGIKTLKWFNKTF